MTEDPEFDAIRAKCEVAAAKIVYEGVAAVHTMSVYRTWENLFPTEREEVMKVVRDGQDTWWITLDDEFKKNGEKKWK